MATLTDPGKLSIFVDLKPTLMGEKVITLAGSKLKLVTGEVTSDGANLINAPTVQYWG